MSDLDSYGTVVVQLKDQALLCKVCHGGLWGACGGFCWKLYYDFFGVSWLIMFQNEHSVVPLALRFCNCFKFFLLFSTQQLFFSVHFSLSICFLQFTVLTYPTLPHHLNSPSTSPQLPIHILSNKRLQWSTTLARSVWWPCTTIRRRVPGRCQWRRETFWHYLTLPTRCGVVWMMLWGSCLVVV